MPHWIGRTLSLLVAALMIADAGAKDLSLASCFSDHMVLQRDVPIAVWGRAKANEKVAVTLGARSAESAAGPDGKWQVDLPALPAGGPLNLSIRSNGEAIDIRDILLGDVFLCSGQSNMQFTFSEAAENQRVLQTVAGDASLRLLMIPKAPGDTPSDQISASWTSSDLESVNRFSAIGIFFAVGLRKHQPDLRQVPIGLVDSSFGGTRVEGWIPSARLAPFKPEDLRESMFGIKPSQLYNAMIAPLAGTRFKGVLWYQGESNAAQADLYRELLKTMISQWRADFRDPALPFFLVQLANFPDPWESYSFAWLREAQSQVAATTDHVYLAVAIDTVDGHDLHPRYKAPAADRLARLAARHLYGADIVSQGPVLKEVTPDANALRVTFDIGNSPLALRGDPAGGFDVAGEDGVFHSATASRIDDDSVRVASEYVHSPRFVRYAWRADPTPTVFNRDGLPAAPFRTDAAPQTPMCEVQAMRPARRVVTPDYAARIEADGRLSSVMIRGQEMLSTDEGGGFMPLGAWGPRSLNNVTEIGPSIVRYDDRGVSITYAFAPEQIRVTVKNETNEALTTRCLLSRLADIEGTFAADRPVTFLRDQSRISIEGIEECEKAFGLIYQVKLKIEPLQTREMVLKPVAPISK